MKSSEYDFQTAQAMLQSRRYIYVIFMCHLSLEKLLKVIILKKTRQTPPRTHDLFTLIRLSSLNIPSKFESIIAHLNGVSVPTRYPEDFENLQKSYTLKVAKLYLTQVGELIKWLRTELN